MALARYRVPSQEPTESLPVSRISTDPLTVARGPGMLIYKLCLTGGVYVEKVASGVAQLLQFGPVAAMARAMNVLDHHGERHLKLAGLHAFHSKESPTTET